MSNKLEKLTPEQEKILIEVRDEWINQVYSLPPLNEEKAREGV